MEITEVRIKLMEEAGERLQAFCSITFDDSFVIRDLKIIDGSNGPFVAMPSRKLTAHCPQLRLQEPSSRRALQSVRRAAGRRPRGEGRRRPRQALCRHRPSDQFGCREMIQQRVIREYPVRSRPLEAARLSLELRRLRPGRRGGHGGAAGRGQHAGKDPGAAGRAAAAQPAPFAQPCGHTSSAQPSGRASSAPPGGPARRAAGHQGATGSAPAFSRTRHKPRTRRFRDCIAASSGTPATMRSFLAHGASGTRRASPWPKSSAVAFAHRRAWGMVAHPTPRAHSREERSRPEREVMRKMLIVTVLGFATAGASGCVNCGNMCGSWRPGSMLGWQKHPPPRRPRSAAIPAPTAAIAPIAAPVAVAAPCCQ